MFQEKIQDARCKSQDARYKMQDSSRSEAEIPIYREQKIKDTLCQLLLAIR